MLGSLAAQRGLAVVDLAVQDVDQRQRGGHVAGPRLGRPQPLEQPPAGHAEQIRYRTRVAKGQQGGGPPDGVGLCDDGFGWRAAVTWRQLHDYGWGRHLTSVPPERVRLRAR
ncbi:hypothetical protein [Geodermatophilus sp. SYSU D00696]